MWEFFRDHGAMLLFTVGALFGFGKMYQRQVDDREKQTELKERLIKLEEERGVTPAACIEHRDTCKLVQEMHYSSTKDDIEDLRVAFKDLKKCNDHQHQSIIERNDIQHNEIIKHLMNITNGNGK